MTEIYKQIVYTITFWDFTASPHVSYGEPSGIAMYNRVTRSDVMKTATPWKIKTLDAIGILYTLGTPMMFVITMIQFAPRMIKRESYASPTFILSIAIGVTLVARIVGLSIIAVSSFPTMDPRYLSPLYPLLLVCIMFNVLLVREKTTRVSQKWYKRVPFS